MLVGLSQLPDYAKLFIDTLPAWKGERAHVVGLVGELGAGKTTFVQKVAELLGIRERVTSPTFVIAKPYDTEHPLFRRLVHIDAYRLGPDEPDTFGFAAYIADPENLVIVEWPERIPGGMPEGARRLSFDVAGEEARQITEDHGKT